MLFQNECAYVETHTERGGETGRDHLVGEINQHCSETCETIAFMN